VPVELPELLDHRSRLRAQETQLEVRRHRH
jgi:hypothetical protein